MFLKCLDHVKPKSIKVISDCVGCSRNTAKVMLEKMLYEKKIGTIEIEGLGIGYIKII